MRKSIAGASAALLLILAGCERGAPEADDATINVADAATYQDRLLAMADGERNAVFIRAIQDAGQECQHVESSARGGDHEGLPVWTARCQGGVEWTIVIGDDGTASVLNPAEAALLGNQAAAQNAQGE